MLKEFKEFAMKGNVLDMAIGVIIGGAFGKIVTSLVSDVLMPPLGLVLGKVDFSSLFLNLSGTPQPSLAAAKAALRHRLDGLLARGFLGLGGDGVLQVEDDGVAVERARLLQRLEVGGGHVEDAAARPGGGGHCGKAHCWCGKRRFLATRVAV